MTYLERNQAVTEELVRQRFSRGLVVAKKKGLSHTTTFTSLGSYQSGGSYNVFFG